MFRPATWLAGALLSSLLAACGSISIPKVELQHHLVTLTPDQSGAMVTLAMDQELTIRLPEEPTREMLWERDLTTGYADRGALASRAGDPAFERERLDTNTFGAAGFDVWVFKPKAAGQQVLRFEYRHRNRAEMPEQVATYTINVQ